MRVRIRSGFRAPDSGGEDGLTAYSVRDRTGSARAAAPEGAEAYGIRDRSGSAQALLVRTGERDRTGRAIPRVLALGMRDRTGRATAASAASDVYLFTYVLAAHTDLDATPIPDYVVRVRYQGNEFKQAPTGRLTNADAWDLRVQLLDGTNLDHEIEAYDATNGIIDLNWTITSYVPNAQFPYRLKLGSFT